MQYKGLGWYVLRAQGNSVLWVVGIEHRKVPFSSACFLGSWHPLTATEWRRIAGALRNTSQMPGIWKDKIQMRFYFGKSRPPQKEV